MNCNMNDQIITDLPHTPQGLRPKQKFLLTKACRYNDRRFEKGHSLFFSHYAAFPQPGNVKRLHRYAAFRFQSERRTRMADETCIMRPEKKRAKKGIVCG